MLGLGFRALRHLIVGAQTGVFLSFVQNELETHRSLLKRIQRPPLISAGGSSNEGTSSDFAE